MKQMTVGLIAGPHRDRARRALTSLVEQSIADEVTVHVVDYAAESEPVSSESAKLRITEAGQDWWLGKARAEVVRRATTPVVGFLEEHCVAERGWAEALVEAHGHADVAAAAGVITNLDSEPLLGKVAALCSYCASLPSVARTETRILFGQNVSYKRDDLMPLDSDLDQYLTTELLLFRYLLGRGRKLRVVPGARFQHAGLEHYSEVLHGVYHYERAAHGLARRRGARSSPVDYLRALLSPAARTVKTALAETRMRGLPLTTVGCLPFAALIHATAAAGQITGRLRGPGQSPSSYSRNELLTRRTALPPATS